MAGAYAGPETGEVQAASKISNQRKLLIAELGDPRQANRERRALPRTVALSRDRAAQHRDEFLNDCESQTETIVGFEPRIVQLPAGWELSELSFARDEFVWYLVSGPSSGGDTSYSIYMPTLDGGAAMASFFSSTFRSIVMTLMPVPRPRPRARCR